MAIGKQSLLAWCADMSKAPCSKLEDLRSGVVLLGVLFKVFPLLAEKKMRVRWAPRFDHEVLVNWDSIEQAIAHLHLPAELFDKPGLMAARFRPTYNLLVALYFLQQVSASSDFTADFAHPIEPPLAAFLQSRAAVESMIAGGAIAAPAGAGPNNATTPAAAASPPGSPPTAPGVAALHATRLFDVHPLLHTPTAATSPMAALDANPPVDAPDAAALAAVAASLLQQPADVAPEPLPLASTDLFTTRALSELARAAMPKAARFPSRWKSGRGRAARRAVRPKHVILFLRGIVLGSGEHSPTA